MLCIKVYYCWCLANVQYPGRCSRSWYLLNKVLHKNITWITTMMLIKSLSWPMMMHKSILITSTAAISTKITMPTHQNELHTQVTWMNMDWTSTYDSSFLVSLWLMPKDDNGLEWWLLRVKSTVSPPSYHFSISQFSTLIISPYKFQKTWSTSFHSNINLGWLFNLRFDYSTTFGGFAWLRVALTVHQCHHKEH